MTLILASESPRRRELLSRLEVRFEVIPSETVEREPRPGEHPEAYALELAGQKAEAVARRHSGAVVLGADTVVAVDGRILGKPVDPDDAVRMLDLLRGRWHEVVTAVAVRCGAVDAARAVVAKVHMRNFTPEEARVYAASGEPLDKAGAYAVQGQGGRLVDDVRGCYNAVVGLPLCAAADLLEHCGVAVETPPDCSHTTDS